MIKKENDKKKYVLKAASKEERKEVIPLSPTIFTAFDNPLSNGFSDDLNSLDLENENNHFGDGFLNTSENSNYQSEKPDSFEPNLLAISNNKESDNFKPNLLAISNNEGSDSFEPNLLAISNNEESNSFEPNLLGISNNEEPINPKLVYKHRGDPLPKMIQNVQPFETKWTVNMKANTMVVSNPNEDGELAFIPDYEDQESFQNGHFNDGDQEKFEDDDYYEAIFGDDNEAIFNDKGEFLNE
ncbi:hypothetical protein G9A89_020472 [Geosiphon pyriformis]|nr:hypothetical protein G9A89_020472 [Geosiphon pyriformis]